MATPVRGKFAVLKDDAGTPNTYSAMNWELNVDGNTEEYSNFRDGIARRDTIEDATLKFELPYEDDVPPDKTGTGNLRLRVGTTITMKAYVDGASSKFYQIPAIVKSITVANRGVKNLLRYTVNCELNGAITYPVWT